MTAYAMLKSRPFAIFLQGAYLVAVTLLIFWVARGWSYDDPYITYRYARNILSQTGFVYNPGERVLSTTTPLLALLLAVPSGIWPNLPELAVLLGAFCLAVGGLLLFHLGQQERSPITGWTALLLYPFFPLGILTLGSETPLYITLLLAVILAYRREKYILVGLLAALAALTRPDAVLLPALLGIHFLLTRNKRPIPWWALGWFAAVCLAWFGFAWAYFGSPLPVTLLAKQQQGEMAISERFLPGLLTVFKGYASSWGYRFAALCGLIGLFGVIRSRRWLLLLTWTAAYFAAYAILGVSRYYWYYAPLVPALVMLVGAGLNLVWQIRARAPGKWKILLAGLLLLAFATVSLTVWRDFWRSRNLTDERIPVYTQVGEWLRLHTPNNASVGALEVGVIGYFSQRRMIDFAGLIEPDIARQLTRETTYEDAALYAVNRYHPDYIALNAGIFPRLRAVQIASRCRLLQTFANGKLAVELFECTW